MRVLSLSLIVFGAAYPLKIETGFINLYSTDLGLVLFILVSVVAIHRKNKDIVFNYNSDWHSSRVFLYVFLFLLLLSASTIYSFNIANSVPLFFDYFRLAVVFLLFRSLSDHSLRRFENHIIVLFYLLIGTGVLQLATNSNIGNPGAFFGTEGVEEITFLGQVRRISGTTQHPNIYAQILCILYIFPANRFILKSQISKFYFIAFLTLLVIGGTLSRASLLVFLIANILLLMKFYSLSGTRSSFVGLISIIFVGLLLLSFFSVSDSAYLVLERFDKIEESERSEFLDLTQKLLSDFRVLFLGTGLGAFFAASSELGLGYSTDTRFWLDLSNTDISVHNVLLLWVVESGVLAGALLIVFFIVCQYRAVYEFLRLKSPYSMLVIVSFVPAMIYMSPARFPLLFFYSLFYFLFIKGKFPK